MTAKCAPADKIVMIDVPDPDNFLSALWTLRQYSQCRVAIVLSIRPVTFAAAHYGGVFSRLHHVIGDVKKLITPLTRSGLRVAEQTWLQTLAVRDRKWFYEDLDLSHADIREDTQLYAVLSAYRLASFLDAHQIARSRWRMYWDPDSISAGYIRLGMRHAFHCHDWTFDFNEEEMTRYCEAVRSISDEDGNVLYPLSESYRSCNRAICETYVRRKADEHSPDEPEQILSPLPTLIELNQKSGHRPTLFLGGPLVDALTYVQQTTIKEAYAMAYTLYRDSTLFALQFNVLVAPEAAGAFIRHVQHHRIKLTILPTECVKQSPFLLSRSELLETLRNSPAAVKLCLQYYDNVSDEATSFALFDLISALVAEHRSLYTKKKVRMVSRQDRPNEDGSADFAEWEVDLSSSIEMCWPDHAYMTGHKPELLIAIKEAVEDAT